MKSLIKLALAALVTYGAWNLGNAWLEYIRFKDDVTQLAQFGNKLSDDDLKDKVLATAAEHTVTFNDLSVRRENQATLVDGSYTQPVNLLPWYAYPWTCQVHVETLTMGGLK